MVMRKQTRDERNAIKQAIADNNLVDKETYQVIMILDDTTKALHKDTGKEFTVSEVQLKGILVDCGLRRRYISYAVISDYEFRN
jgi:hypothetical protein